jgi:nucleotide-binding universal stress UspA family protein
MFETILLAVDGSEPSNRAVGTALDLATKLGSELIVVHVREHETGRMAREPGPSDEAEELVDETVRKVKNAGVSARGEVHTAVFGRAARAILEVANESGASMVVMGSRGLSDLAGLVMGSVTHKVLHLARCPVLVVR